jgi:hypothetical protein
MPFWEDDIDAFFGDFGEAVTYTAADSSTKSIYVIWDDPFDRLNQKTGANIAISKTQCTCKATDLLGVTKVCKITKSSIQYNIIGIENDGKGTILLILSKD